MIGHVRKGLLYFMRDPLDRVPGVATTAADAIEHLMAYYDLMDPFTQSQLCKYNLHVCVCKLPSQELQRGPVPQCSEFHIERHVQKCKSGVRYRTTSDPEKTLGKGELLEWSMATIRAKHPHLLDVAGHFPETPDLRRNRVLRKGHLLQDSPDTHGSMALGWGKALDPLDPSTMEDLVIAKEAFRKMMQDVKVRVIADGWDPEQSEHQLDQASYVKYTAMDLAREEVVHGQAYRMAKTRVSYNVLCEYESPDPDAEPLYYVSMIRFFVVATLELDGKKVTCKYGVGDMWQLSVVENDMGQYWESLAYPHVPPPVDLRGIGVHVLDMRRKLLMDHPTQLQEVLHRRRRRGPNGEAPDPKFRAVKATGCRFLPYGGRSREHRNRH
jgi:hypothetical protein